jgi:oligoendopeptidase F
MAPGARRYDTGHSAEEATRNHLTLPVVVAFSRSIAYLFPGQETPCRGQTAASTIEEGTAGTSPRLYATDAAERVRSAFEKKIDAMSVHRGHLGESPQTMLAALRAIDVLNEEFRRLASYSAMKSDLDKMNAADLARSQEMDQTGARLGAATSFLAPEVLALPEGTVEAFLKAEPALTRYAHDQGDIEDAVPIPLARLLRTWGPSRDPPRTSRSPRERRSAVSIWLARAGCVDQSAYSQHHSRAPGRPPRRVRGFFTTWKGHERTLGSPRRAFKEQLRARAPLRLLARASWIVIRAGPCLRRHARAANESLPRSTLHEVRARILGLPDLAYHDIYAPLVPPARATPSTRPRGLVLDAVAPLGPDYVATLARGYDARWIHVWPSRGKRAAPTRTGGAPASFHPDELPGNFDGVSTLAHERHCTAGWRTTPSPSRPPTIRSSSPRSRPFNEALLYRYAIDHAKDDDEKLSLLSAWLDAARGTFFRQAMFAEFERAIARAAEGGESLTGESLDRMYLALIRKYHGSDQGVCAVDDLYSVEWAYIPHFYANFYVYQYATGFAASTSLARRVLANEPGSRDRFLDFLKSGGSDYPFELLKKAGVDLTAPDPYRETVAEMNRTMDAIDAILDRKRPSDAPPSVPAIGRGPGPPSRHVRFPVGVDWTALRAGPRFPQCRSRPCRGDLEGVMPVAYPCQRLEPRPRTTGLISSWSRPVSRGGEGYGRRRGDRQSGGG